MSADNFLFVGKKGDKYAVTDRSASVDCDGEYADVIEHDEWVISEHDTAREAWDEAARLDYTGEHYTEYGISASEDVARQLGFIS